MTRKCTCIVGLLEEKAWSGTIVYGKCSTLYVAIIPRKMANWKMGFSIGAFSLTPEPMTPLAVTW